MSSPASSGTSVRLDGLGGGEQTTRCATMPMSHASATSSWLSSLSSSSTSYCLFCRYATPIAIQWRKRNNPRSQSVHTVICLAPHSNGAVLARTDHFAITPPRVKDRAVSMSTKNFGGSDIDACTPLRRKY